MLGFAQADMFTWRLDGWILDGVNQAGREPHTKNVLAKHSINTPALALPSRRPRLGWLRLGGWGVEVLLPWPV